jgi:hypothetical protein
MRFVFTTVTLLLFYGNALAADIQYCAKYTADSVSWATEVQKLKCPFDLSSPQWSTDEHVHRNWCLGANESSVDDQIEEKRQAYLQCADCRAYAEAAMDAVKKNIALHCGFEITDNLARWQDDYASHFNWCMGLAFYSDTVFTAAANLDDATEQESAARSLQIGECEVQHKSDPLTAQPKHIGHAKTYKLVPKERGVMNQSCLPGTRLASGQCGNVSPSKVIGSGLLESDQASSSRGPAATGVPGAASSGAGGAGGGGSLRGSTYSNPTR